MLPQKAIDEYKEIFKKQFGEDISDEEAQKQGYNLINLVKPIPKKFK